MKENNKAWLEVVDRLKAQFAVDGRAALDRMTPISVHVLYNEFMTDLNAVNKQLAEHPSDEVGLQRKTMLERDIGVVAGWMKEHSRNAAPAHLAKLQPDAKTIREMLDDVEAVTKARFYEDPEPIASPVEMFRMPEGMPGGEPFAALSGRERLQVLDYHVRWYDFEKRGVSFEQRDRVFANVIDGKPREQWLEGTGISLPPERTRMTTLEKLRQEIEADTKAARSEAELLARTRAEKELGPRESKQEKVKDRDMDR